MAINRQHQAWQIQDRQRYNNNREQYLRNWAREVAIGMWGSLKDCPDDINALTVEELQEWYDEAHQQ